MAKILLIEDDFILASDFVDALESHGHKVDATNSAIAAMEMCKAKSFDLAVVDIFIKGDGAYIPDGGISFLSKLRQYSGSELETSKYIPVIAISGGILTGTDHCPLRNARELGATATMAKPFSTDDLVEQVNLRVV